MRGRREGEMSWGDVWERDGRGRCEGRCVGRCEGEM